MVISAKELAAGGDGTTGRFIATFQDKKPTKNALKKLNNVAGISAVSIKEFDGAEPDDDVDVVLDEIGVAILKADPDRIQALETAGDSSGLYPLEAEQIVYAIGCAEYVQGYADGVADLAARIGKSPEPEKAEDSVGAGLADTSDLTWGLQAIDIDGTRDNGTGIKVAVLDTGIDETHPDLRTKIVASQSFIRGEAVQDGNGHGTHCSGTAAGPKHANSGPRYGVASGAGLLIGKVLSNAGSGADGGILRGIDWALSQGADVISMSLGAYVRPGQGYPRNYERVAQRALERGSLIIAAAGNDSKRYSGTVEPVGRPANCPSILSVAAMDSASAVAYFSNGSVNLGGGQIDIIGPGVDVRSAWPGGYRSISGTSMATPHVAGVAAVLASGSNAPRGVALWQALVATARRNALSSADAGTGLVRVS